MKFDWENWGMNGRVIFVALCVALVSMFMSWVDVGFLSQSGIQQQGWLLLVFWIYPVYVLLKNLEMNKILGLLTSALSIVGSVAYLNWKTIELFGNTAHVAGTGVWLFLFSSIALFVGVLNYERSSMNISKRGLFFCLITLLTIGMGVVVIIGTYTFLFEPIKDNPNSGWVLICFVAIFGVLYYKFRSLFIEYAKLNEYLIGIMKNIPSNADVRLFVALLIGAIGSSVGFATSTNITQWLWVIPIIFSSIIIFRGESTMGSIRDTLRKTALFTVCFSVVAVGVFSVIETFNFSGALSLTIVSMLDALSLTIVSMLPALLLMVVYFVMGMGKKRDVLK